MSKDWKLSGGVSVDLEVNPKHERIFAFAAVRDVSKQSILHRNGNLLKSLALLDQYAADADFILGHNIIKFDLPQLKAANPNLRILRKPALDTLRLSPLAFPRYPYHHLVKHYQDPRILGNQRNDPGIRRSAHDSSTQGSDRGIQAMQSELATLVASALLQRIKIRCVRCFFLHPTS